MAEIGHFVAHHQERDKGIVTRSTREWSAAIRFHASVRDPTTGKPNVLDTQKMPVATRDYFEIAVNRVDPRMIRQKTDLKQKAADKAMRGLCNRLKQNPDGTWALPSDVTRTEFSLANCVASVLVVRPAFTAERLVDDFIATLRSNGLITKEEIREHRDALNLIVQLYAVAAMHNCVVQTGDGNTIQLKARPEVEVKEIWVNAAVLYAARPNLFFSSSMFTAQVDPSTHCHPDLLATKEWNFEIEVAPDRRLSRL